MFSLRSSTIRTFKLPFCIWGIKQRILCSEIQLPLIDVLISKIHQEQEQVTEFRKEYGKEKICDVTVDMVYGGMRHMSSLVHEPSIVDPEEGVIFRGLTLNDCISSLPKAKNGSQPLPEGMLYFLLVNEIPSEDQINQLSREWANRAVVPKHVCALLNGLPAKLHPLSQMTCALTALSHDSQFQKAYSEGANKSEFFKYVFEDCMDLIAKLPVVTATIYRNVAREGKGSLLIDPEADWASNFGYMLGIENEKFVELLRLFLTIYSDHSGGGVTNHATHLVGSALTDPYMSYAAGLSALAGPLSGKACQDAFNWLVKLRNELGDNPSDSEICAYVALMLESEQTVPGYGHAVLRKTDPRFTCLQDFGNAHMPDDPLFKLNTRLTKIIPEILREKSNVNDPWPNVDANVGLLLNHYGLKDANFYPVLCGVSRAIGVFAALVWSRAMRFPIERPKSVSTDVLQSLMTCK